MGKIILLFLQAVCCLLWAEYSMAGTEEIMANILNLTDAEFFSEEDSVLTQREFQLVDLDFWGVIVNAPRQILTDRHDKLPLLIATRYSGDRGWDVRVKDNSILVGTNLQDGTVHFAKAFVSERELASRGREKKALIGPKPSGLPIRSAAIRLVDAQRRLHIRWNTGSWALGVIYYDWPSNTVVVELNGDEPSQSSPPARSVYPPPNLAGAGLGRTSKKGVEALPCYLPTPQTPEFPDSGVSFTVESRVEKGKQRLIVSGAFAVTVRDLHLPGQKVIHHFQDGPKENVAAVIPVTMAVLALDWDDPLQFDWAVPVYGAQLKVGMPGRGSFAIDALANGKTQSLGPGKYVCYIIIEGRIFGPQTFEIQ